MKVLSETELSSSATSYRIEVEDEDLRREETSEERYQRYLGQVRKARSRHQREHQKDSQPPSTGQRP
jgi:hypothetical protein